MKSSTLLIGVISIVIIGGAGIYAMANREPSITEPKSMEKPSTMNTMGDGETPSIEPPEQMMGTKEAYVPFSPEVLASSADTRRVLFFFANWCPTCKPADESFAKNVAQIPADVTVIRVNYNDTETDQAEKDLAKKYGVTYQHTFVQIDADGAEVTKWNGGKLEELLSNIL